MKHIMASARGRIQPGEEGLMSSRKDKLLSGKSQDLPQRVWTVALKIFKTEQNTTVQAYDPQNSAKWLRQMFTTRRN